MSTHARFGGRIRRTQIRSEGALLASLREAREKEIERRGFFGTVSAWIFGDEPPKTAWEIVRPRHSLAVFHLGATVLLALAAYACAVICLQPSLGPMPRSLDALLWQIAISGGLVAGAVGDWLTVVVLSTAIGSDLGPAVAHWQGRAVLRGLFTTHTLLLVPGIGSALRTAAVLGLLRSPVSAPSASCGRATRMGGWTGCS